MNKRKDAVALFEVMSKSSHGQSEAAESEPVKATGPERPSPERQVRPSPVAAQQAGAAGAEPVVSTSGGRLRFSLNYLTCSVAAMGLVLLLVGAFLAGRASAPGQQARADLPGPGQAAPGAPGAERQGPSAQVPARQEGKHYLVIQSMLGDDRARKQEADRIVEYLRLAGEPADVIRLRSSDGSEQLVVLSLRGFASPTDPAALKHAETIEKHGQNYFQQTGTYKFGQRTKGQFFFIPYRSSSAGN